MDYAEDQFYSAFLLAASSSGSSLSTTVRSNRPSLILFCILEFLEQFDERNRFLVALGKTMVPLIPRIMAMPMPFTKSIHYRASIKVDEFLPYDGTKRLNQVVPEDIPVTVDEFLEDKIKDDAELKMARVKLYRVVTADTQDGAYLRYFVCIPHIGKAMMSLNTRRISTNQYPLMIPLPKEGEPYYDLAQELVNLHTADRNTGKAANTDAQAAASAADISGNISGDEASDDEDASDDAAFEADESKFACIGRDVLARAFKMKIAFITELGRDDPCPDLKKDDTLYDKSRQMDVGRVTRFASCSKFFLGLAQNEILEEEIPRDDLSLQALTARERLSFLGMAIFAEKMDELFMQVLMSPKALTEAMLQTGEKALRWFLQWHMMFNPTLSGNVFKVCVHRYHLQGLFGLFRTLRNLLTRITEMNRKYPWLNLRIKCSRLSNSPTESGFCELRVCSGMSVLDGVRLSYIFPQILAQEIRGNRQLKYSIKRADYVALDKMIEKMHGQGEE